MQKNFKNSWFTIAELVVSSVILMVIAVWLFVFLNTSYKNISVDLDKNTVLVSSFQDEIYKLKQDWYFFKEIKTSGNNKTITFANIENTKFFSIFSDWQKMALINKENPTTFPDDSFEIENFSVVELNSWKIKKIEFKIKENQKTYTLYF